jgi:hypothetical protein
MGVISSRFIGRACAAQKPAENIGRGWTGGGVSLSRTSLSLFLLGNTEIFLKNSESKWVDRALIEARQALLRFSPECKTGRNREAAPAKSATHPFENTGRWNILARGLRVD